MELTLRPAAPTDAAALEHLATLQNTPSAGASRVPDPLAYVATLLDAQAEEGATLIVALHGADIVGHVLIARPLSVPGVPGSCAQLSDLYVHPDFRRARVGSRLTAEAERCARAAGAARIALKVLAGNHDAVDFYRQHDYEDVFLVMSRALA